MKKLRILALFNEGHLPPASQAELGGELDDAWAAFELVDVLRRMGHEVEVLGVHDELAPIRMAIERGDPHIVFNQILDFHGAALYDAHVVSYLELLKVRYTGCNPRGILLASDKTLAKKILTYHRIRTPRFFVAQRGRRVRLPSKLSFPLFVKSALEHGSVGISQASIVSSQEALEKRVAFVHESVQTDAVVEQYIEGRELTVTLLGNQRITALPVFELFFRTVPEGTAPIATAKVKWSRKYQKKLGIENGPAEIEADKEREIVRIGKRVFRALGMSGYARIDFRMDAEGTVYVLEANPTPDLTPGEDAAASAEVAGLEYGDLLNRILSLGMAYEPGWMSAG